jgi:hypothetical protein
MAAGATLTLHDKSGREAGSLIVQLQDTTAQARTAAIDGPINDIEQHLPTSLPIPETVQNVINSTAAVGHLTGSVVDSLKQVMDKTTVVVDFVDKAAKVPCHWRWWHVVSWW